MVWDPFPISSLPTLTAFSHVWIVLSGIPNSLAALAPPISLDRFTACTLYSWSYLCAALNTSCSPGFIMKSLRISCQLFHITPSQLLLTFILSALAGWVCRSFSCFEKRRRAKQKTTCYAQHHKLKHRCYTFGLSRLKLYYNSANVNWKMLIISP